MPRLAARSSQSNLREFGPEVLKRERGHMTSKSGISEVGVFRALQPNDRRDSRGLKSPFPNITSLTTYIKVSNKWKPSRQATTMGESGIDLMILGAMV